MTTPAAQFRMLQDELRTLAYRAAIFATARDRVVLDLGCGSGILSIFAAQAGARHVYAVERRAVAVLARLMLKANDVEDRITLIRDDSRKVTLPERADLLVHEIFGSDPLSEGLIPAIDDARDRLLKPGGQILPGRVEIGCFGIEPPSWPLSAERVDRESTRLSERYGVRLSPLDLALQTWDPSLRRHVDLADSVKDHVLTEETILWDLDLTRPVARQVEATVHASLRANKPGRVGAVLVFFRAHLGDGQVLSTSPLSPRTHWGFSATELSSAVTVARGDTLAIRASVETAEDRQTVVVDVATAHQ